MGLTSYFIIILWRGTGGYTETFVNGYFGIQVEQNHPLAGPDVRRQYWFPPDVFPLLSLSTNSSTSEIVSAAFSNPPSLLPDWLIILHSWFNFQLKNTPWKCRLKTIFPLRWPKISKRTCFSTMERSPTAATSAVTQLSVLPCWKDTWWFTVERSLLFANSATTPAHELVPSKRTW